MKYTFNRHNPIPDSIVFVLILDMKRKKERILIGNENYIELRLRGSEEDNIFYDRTAPLGSLLMNFHQDTERAWNEFGFMPFWDALHSNRWKQTELEKMGFDARAVENSYDRTYKNECQRWRNIIHRAEKSEDTSPETLSKMKSAFEAFKAEALKRKTAVKKGQSSSKEFEDWILVQSSILYKL